MYKVYLCFYKATLPIHPLTNILLKIKYAHISQLWESDITIYTLSRWSLPRFGNCYYDFNETQLVPCHFDFYIF